MIGSFIDRINARVCYGSGGGGGSDGGWGGGRSVAKAAAMASSSTQTINTKDKANRDGTKALTTTQLAGHLAANSGISVTISGSPSITMSPTCGSCHDPVKK